MILVTGASGFVGSNVLQLLNQRGIGVYHSNPLQAHGVQLDLTHEQPVLDYLNQTQPSAIIHCAAYANAGFCQKHPKISAQLNVTATELLAKWCATNNRSFVFTSTDLVFDGQSKQPYDEQCKPNPLSIYGLQKLEAEKVVQKASGQHKIARLSLVYGKKGAAYAGYLAEFMLQIQQQEAITLFTDEFRTPVWVKDVARALIHLTSAEGGTYHVTGPELMSRFEFGEQLIAYDTHKHKLLKPTLQAELKLSAPRPKNLHLVSSKNAFLNFKFHAVHEVVQCDFE